MKKDRLPNIGFTIEEELHKRFRVATVERGETMKGVLLDYIKRYVEDHEREKAKQGK